MMGILDVPNAGCGEWFGFRRRLALCGGLREVAAPPRSGPLRSVGSAGMVYCVLLKGNVCSGLFC